MVALKLIKQPVETAMIPYDDGVIMGKKIMSDIADKQWQLGDLANALEPKYGDTTLRKFAAEIGCNFKTLQKYRTTARSWPELPVRTGNYCVAEVLSSHPDRQEIVRDNPGITIREAREARKIMIKSKRAANEKEDDDDGIVYPYQEPCTDCNSAEEQWQRSVANFLGDVLTMMPLWDRLFGDDWKTYKIPSSHIKLVMDAEKEIKKMAAILKEHPRDTEN